MSIPCCPIGQSSSPFLSKPTGHSRESQKLKKSRTKKMQSFVNLVLIPLLLSSFFIISSSSESIIQLPRARARARRTCPVPNPALNYRPVIGILTHPGDGYDGLVNNGTGVTSIAASYVKFVESAGARVVPLIHTEPWEVISEKLKLVNGVLFTGGSAMEGLYYETAKKIFQVTLERNDAGEHFPLIGICLGFELLSMIISENHDILERFNAQDQASTLQFINIADTQGTIFESFPPELLRKFSTECLVMQNHQFGVSPKRLQETDALSSFFKIVTTTPDDEGQVYVSTVQGLKYPVSATQWHPEKNAFEWYSAAIPHSQDAIRVTQHVANFFISEARKSSNKPPAQAVRDNIIYNYPLAYGSKNGEGFDEVYIFS